MERLTDITYCNWYVTVEKQVKKNHSTMVLALLISPQMNQWGLNHDLYRTFTSTNGIHFNMHVITFHHRNMKQFTRRGLRPTNGVRLLCFVILTAVGWVNIDRQLTNGVLSLRIWGEFQVVFWGLIWRWLICIWCIYRVHYMVAIIDIHNWVLQVNEE